MVARVVLAARVLRTVVGSLLGGCLAVVGVLQVAARALVAGVYEVTVGGCYCVCIGHKGSS